jgi:uncharacterized protein
MAARAVMFGRWAGAFFALLLILGVATVSAAPDYPALTGRVVDQAGLLGAQSRTGLEAKLAQHEAKTGEQVVVVTASSLDGQSIEEYGVGLGRHWGIGTRGEDNGALLIVAPDEREVRIEVGYGLEGKLTDALASQIVQNEILPRFRDGDMEGGIVAGAEAVLAILDGSYVPGEWSLPPEAAAAQEPMLPDWIVPLIFFGVWGLIVFFVHRSRRGRRYGPWIGGAGLGGFGGGRSRGGFPGRSSGGGFSGRGGSFGGGGASGRW